MSLDLNKYTKATLIEWIERCSLTRPQASDLDQLERHTKAMRYIARMKACTAESAELSLANPKESERWFELHEEYDRAHAKLKRLQGR